jgi:hypothetical protein
MASAKWTRGSKWRQRGKLRTDHYAVRMSDVVKASMTSQEIQALAMEFLPQIIKANGGLPELPSRESDRATFTYPGATVQHKGRPLVIGVYIDSGEMTLSLAYEDEPGKGK